MLSETQPNKVNQLIQEHENFTLKMEDDWDTQITQAAQNLRTTYKYKGKNVPNYAITDALKHVGVSLNLVSATCMKKLVVNKMALLATNERQEKSIDRKQPMITEYFMQHCITKKQLNRP